MLYEVITTCYWPLYEIENGTTKITVTPKQKLPIVDFLKPQGRFKHLFSPENEGLLTQVQDEIDREWEKLLKEAKTDCRITSYNVCYTKLLRPGYCSSFFPVCS